MIPSSLLARELVVGILSRASETRAYAFTFYKMPTTSYAPERDGGITKIGQNH
jgi:hypothetical protein